MIRYLISCKSNLKHCLSNHTDYFLKHCFQFLSTIEDLLPTLYKFIVQDVQSFIKFGQVLPEKQGHAYSTHML